MWLRGGRSNTFNRLVVPKGKNRNDNVPVGGTAGVAGAVDRAMGLSMAVLVPNIVSAVVEEVCRGTFEPVCKPKSIISMQKQNVFFFRIGKIDPE